MIAGIEKDPGCGFPDLNRVRNECEQGQKYLWVKVKIKINYHRVIGDGCICKEYYHECLLS